MSTPATAPARAFDAVAFDLDGTLLDTPALIVATIEQVLAARGAPPIPADQLRATVGIPLDVAFSELLGIPRDDPGIQATVVEYRRAFNEQVGPRGRELLFPGVEDGLRRLRAHGLRLAVATSKVRAGAEPLLASAGILDQFETLVCADMVARPKPYPDTAAAVAQRLGVAARRTVVVGDTSYDLAMAEAAGMPSVAVTYGAHGDAVLAAARPGYVAHTFGEAVAYILGERGEGRADSV